jgi:DNA-binding MarR family transcriptional regulator
MAAEEIGERHRELLRVLDELARSDPDGLADMDRAAQRMGLDTVGKESDRAEFEALANALEEAGYMEVQGSDLAASYRRLSVTEEGRNQLKGSS